MQMTVSGVCVCVCITIERRENSLPAGFLGRLLYGWYVRDLGPHPGAGQDTVPRKNCPSPAQGEGSPWGAAALMLCSPTALQEGAGAAVGTQQEAGQDVREGECKGHPGVQGY